MGPREHNEIAMQTIVWRGPMQRFHLFGDLLCKLTEDEARTLQVLNELGEASLTQLREILDRSGKPDVLYRLKPLEVFGLALCHQDFWEPSWMGAGVANWREQLVHCAGMPMSLIPQPIEGENGRDPGPPCHDFRELYFKADHCWCSRSRLEHSLETLGSD